MFAGSAACVVVTLCITIGIGTSFAGAGGVNTAGFGASGAAASEDASQTESPGAASDTGVRESSQLSNSAQRDITKGIETIEAPISLSKVALVDPETKKRVRAGFREDTVERGGRTRTVRVRVARGGAKRGVEQGKEI